MAKTAQLFDAPRQSVYLMDPADIVIIGLDTKHKIGDHPLADERNALPVNRALVDSIKAHGFRSTVRVRKEGESAVAVDGRQRVRAARVANEELIAEGREPVRVEVRPDRADDATAMGIMILSNEIKQEDDTLTKAAKAARYLGTGKTEEEVAYAFGVKSSTIDMWMALLELHPEVQALVREGKLGAKAAARLSVLAREAQLKAARELVAGGRGTVDGVAEKVREIKATAKRPVAAVESEESEDSEESPAPAPKAGPAYARPGLSTLRRLKKLSDRGQARLSLDNRLMLAWVLGEGPASDVPGLAEALGVAVHRGPRPSQAPMGEVLDSD